MLLGNHYPEEIKWTKAVLNFAYHKEWSAEMNSGVSYDTAELTDRLTWTSVGCNEYKMLPVLDVQKSIH